VRSQIRNVCCQREHRNLVLAVLDLVASLRICAGVSAFSSAIPARNCSADPDQKRSMVCWTDRAARLRGGTDAR